MEISDYQSFKSHVMTEIEQLPSCWRKGQKVFNYVDEVYGVARDVQFEDHVDCFYDDNEIDGFLEAAWKRIGK